MMYGRGYGYYGDMMGGYGWFGGLIMLFLTLLVLAGIVLLVIWAIRALSGGHPQQAAPPVHPAPPVPPANAGHDEAVAVAKRRLAAGEITTEQYQEIMRALGS